MCIYIFICLLIHLLISSFIHLSIFIHPVLLCCIFMEAMAHKKKDKHDTLPEESGDCPVHFFEEQKGAITI